MYKICESGKKAWWKKSLVEKMAVERKPGSKKAWSVLEKMKKSLVSFFRFDTYIKINDEVKLTHYFIHLISKCVWYIYFIFLVQFILK